MSGAGSSSSSKEFPVLHTERLHLRAIVEDDRDAIFGIFSDAKTLEHYDIDPFEKEKDAADLIAFFADRERRGTGLRWGICLPGREDSPLIGTCGFNRYERIDTRRGVVGYDLSRAHWGHGYVPEAMAAVVRYGFEELGLNRIEAYIEPKNRPSVRVMEKLGFTREGLLRQFAYYRRALRDQYCFSLLAKEWREAHGS
jgi:ribosomal-protein-alanine N-acetyltransferase